MLRSGTADAIMAKHMQQYARLWLTNNHTQTAQLDLT